MFRHTVPDSVFLCFDERVSGGKNKGSYITAGGISTKLFPGCSQPLAEFLQCFRVLVEFVKKMFLDTGSFISIMFSDAGAVCEDILPDLSRHW